MSDSKKNIVQAIARFGFIGKGVVYFVVGLLALEAAIGIGGSATGTKQALQDFIYAPFGTVLLIICIAGLLAHGLWQFIRTIFDVDDFGKDFEGIFFRIVYFVVGGLYLSLSYAAWQILQGLNTSSSSKKTEVWIAKILDLPYGKWIVYTLAFIIAITGIYQFYSAYKASFDYNFDKSSMEKYSRELLRTLGRIGFTAWGVVYEMMAFLFFQAARSYNANQAGGLSDALKALRKQPYGAWVLGITAAGLLIYGIYLFILSYYRQIFSS